MKRILYSIKNITLPARENIFKAFSITLLAITVVSSIFRTVTGNIYGIFGLVIGLYLLAPNIFSVEPYSGTELLVWYSNLSDGYKISITSSLLTVVGFIIAFFISSLSWKNELKSKIELDAANDMQMAYGHITSLAIDVNTFIGLVADTLNMIGEKGPLDPESISSAKFIMNERQKYTDNQMQLSRLSIDIHSLAGRHTLVLASRVGAYRTILAVNKAVGNIRTAMYVYVPDIDIDDPEICTRLQSRVNREEAESSRKIIRKEIDYISGAVGGINGQIQDHILRPGIFSLFAVIKKISQWQQHVITQYKRTKDLENQ